MYSFSSLSTHVQQIWRLMEKFTQVWVYAVIVTEAGAYKNDDENAQKYCRTDQSNVLSQSPWFRYVWLSFLAMAAYIVCNKYYIC